MEQMTLIKMPYKYIMDTSSILSQKENEQHRRIVYKSQWKRIEEKIAEKIIVTCSEVIEEIKDDIILKWLNQRHCEVLDIDDIVQINVRQIVTEYPKMIDFAGNSGTSSGDAFLIATAMAHNLIVITEENKKKSYKIPWICEKYNIESLNITELCERENWTF